MCSIPVQVVRLGVHCWLSQSYCRVPDMPPKAIPGQLYSSSTQSFLAIIPFTGGGEGISEPGRIEHKCGIKHHAHDHMH